MDCPRSRCTDDGERGRGCRGGGGHRPTHKLCVSDWDVLVQFSNAAQLSSSALVKVFGELAELAASSFSCFAGSGVAAATV